MVNRYGEAEALRLYAIKHGYSREAQNHVAEIAMRTERRMDELSAALPAIHTGRPPVNCANVGAIIPSKKATLQAAKISHQEASRFEQVAALPTR